jgi:hypothetical protein
MSQFCINAEKSLTEVRLSAVKKSKCAKISVQDDVVNPIEHPNQLLLF